MIFSSTASDGSTAAACRASSTFSSRHPRYTKQFGLLQNGLCGPLLLVGRIAVIAEDVADDDANERDWTRYFFERTFSSLLSSFCNNSTARLRWGRCWTSARNSSDKIEMSGFFNPAASKMSATLTNFRHAYSLLPCVPGSVGSPSSLRNLLCFSIALVIVFSTSTKLLWVSSKTISASAVAVLM